MKTQTKLFLIKFIPIKHIRHKLRKKLVPVVLNYTMGEHSYSGADFIAPGTIIGKYCSIATRVKIGADFHPTDYITTSPCLMCEHYANGDIQRFPKVEIGNDVWIGYNVLVLKSCKIGTGAIIGAGAVITHDVPPYAVVVGAPGRVIRYRYPKATIKRMLESKWWDLPYDLLKTVDFFTTPNDFLQSIEKLRGQIKRNVS